MSSPSKENQKPAGTDDLETTSTAAATEVPQSKDNATAAQQIRDEPTQQARTSPTKFAFDETLFGSAPQADDTAIEDDDDDEIPYPEEDETSLLPPPDFKPLFTLIEDPTTGVHHHPTVHYIFSDDDPDILTDAALEAISEEQNVPENERFVIVDMSADGREVVSVSSLSPNWQALKTKVTQAPSWGDDSKTGDRGLMLRISGQEAEVGNDRGRKGDVDGLLKAFDDLAGSLEGVLGSTTDTQIVQ